MGYSGLKSSIDSDTAADLQYHLIHDMVATLELELKDKGNQYNTSGIVNVAFVFDELILPAAKNFVKSDDGNLTPIAEQTLAGLKELIKGCSSTNKNWDTDENRLEHRKHYKRLARSVEKFLLIVDQERVASGAR